MEKARRYRLLFADDHEGVREEIRQLLEPDFEVLRLVGDCVQLVEAARELEIDAVVSDVQLPHMSGIEAGRQILGRGLCEAVVVLSMFPDAHLVKAAMAAGIRAYVLKVDAGEGLIPAIHTALGGKQYLSQGIQAG